ncbi:MAG: SUMF1/EgtB/PvdO family nonheme iron enzyme [Gallionella sp.]|nr:SUMF1/EgtB/PvdO family nonheme iron enzyme [Gallionella sp.]
MTQSSPTPIEALKALLDAGLLQQVAYDAAVSAMQAQLTGNGAIAQGENNVALGAGSVYINGNFNFDGLLKQGTQANASKEDMQRAYLACILQSADELPLFANDKKLKLSSVYTALLTQRSESNVIEKSPEQQAKLLSALDVLNAEKKLVLLGGPGSGKSTFVNFVALSMAGELLGDNTLNLASLTAPLPNEQDSRPQHWDHGGLLPVLITLRDFASQLPPAGCPVNAETVCTHLQKKLQAYALADFYPHLRDEMLQGRAMILFDGLDEVPDADERRLQIKQAVQEFAKTFFRSRFLVTSRTYAYQRQDWKLDGFAAVDLLPFTLGQIHRFVEVWYQQMVHLHKLTAVSAADRAEVLLRTVERNERLFKLAERPLLLTLIAQIQTDKGGDLPEKPEQLYDKAVEMLLNQWEGMKKVIGEKGEEIIQLSLAEYLDVGKDKIRKQLNRLAFEAHRDQPDLRDTASIRQADLICALMNASPTPEKVKPKLLERYLSERAGILAAHGNKMYQFPHRSFQEYLAACHLTDDDFPEQLVELFLNDTNRWREVVLLAGAKAARGAAVNAWMLSETLCPEIPTGQDDEKDHFGALLAGRVLVESADLSHVARRDLPKLDRIRTWQLAILRQNVLPALDRALAGRTLATLGDTRQEVMTLDEMQFCYVPAGSFTMGEGEEAHSVTLQQPYWMARFPVTLAQWREYLQCSGNAPDDDDSLKGHGNVPVANVTWHDARRFCDYLTQAWQAVLPKGYIVTLPSEAEWEQAARGGEWIPDAPRYASVAQMGKCVETPLHVNASPQRGYPWGDDFDADKANVNTPFGEASVVGCYPLGASPYGCEEMSGNVWEWTRSLWGRDRRKPEYSYPYQPDDGRENLDTDDTGGRVLKVLRGGSWGWPSDYARCALRFWVDPNFRIVGIGFRVVLRFSPVNSGL